MLIHASGSKKRLHGKDQTGPVEDGQTHGRLPWVDGDDNDPSLRPSARLSYLAIGERIPEAETEEEWNARLKWAWEHLEA